MQKLSKTISALILTIAAFCAAGCTKDNSGNGTYNGHDYIDLGLPSGTMWATCNVGADTPINTAIHLLGARPPRKPPTIGAPINTAMAIITSSQSIAANRILASMASLTIWSPFNRMTMPPRSIGARGGALLPTNNGSSC